MLRRRGFSPATEEAIGCGRMTDRLHGRAAIGCWNLLICLHQSSPVRWLWHAAKSMLSICSDNHQWGVEIYQSNKCFLFLSFRKWTNFTSSCLFVVYCRLDLPWASLGIEWVMSRYKQFVFPFNSWPHKQSICGYYCTDPYKVLLRHKLQVCDVFSFDLAHRRHLVTFFLSLVFFVSRIKSNKPKEPSR